MSLLNRNTDKETEMNTATKVINWAASQSNAHGAHIEAISHAINTGDFTTEVTAEIEAKRKEWVSEHETRLKVA